MNQVKSLLGCKSNQVKFFQGASQITNHCASARFGASQVTSQIFASQLFESQWLVYTSGEKWNGMDVKLGWLPPGGNEAFSFHGPEKCKLWGEAGGHRRCKLRLRVVLVLPKIQWFIC